MSVTEPRIDGLVAWPRSAVEEYRRAGWWAGETLAAAFDRWAGTFGSRVAVVDGDRHVTYQALADRSARLAAGLVERGLRRDDRVVTQLANGLGFCELLLALARIGALPVMALPSHRQHEIGYMVEHSGAVALAVPGRGSRFDHLGMAVDLRGSSNTLELVLVDGDPGQEREGLVSLGDLDKPVRSFPFEGPTSDDVLLFLLSGGTTGLPKLIPRSHDDYLYNARASARLCGFDERTAYLTALPVSHNFPLACPGVLGTWSAGGRVVMLRDPSPTGAVEVIEREAATATAVVPTVALRWFESTERERFARSTLDLLQVGGARLLPELARRIGPGLGCTLQQVFGMAEGLLNFTRLDDPVEVMVETQGRPLSPGDEVLVVDALDRPVADGEPGELLTRGPYTLRGYYRAEEQNARAFTADGYYRSGDVVVRHPDGNLVVHGRSKDLINRGGEKVSAEEVENLVLGHPAVFNVAAVAMPDRELGERTCVFVVVREGYKVSLTSLREHLEHLGVARYKFPERVVIVAELPVTKVGKIDKGVLRERIREQLLIEGGTP